MPDSQRSSSIEASVRLPLDQSSGPRNESSPDRPGGACPRLRADGRRQHGGGYQGAEVERAVDRQHPSGRVNPVHVRSQTIANDAATIPAASAATIIAPRRQWAGIGASSRSPTATASALSGKPGPTVGTKPSAFAHWISVTPSGPRHPATRPPVNRNALSPDSTTAHEVRIRRREGFMTFSLRTVTSSSTDEDPEPDPLLNPSGRPPAPFGTFRARGDRTGGGAGFGRASSAGSGTG